MENVITIAVARAKKFEGFKGEIYLCPSGFKTIGYGHNLETNPIDEDKYNIVDGKISKEDAENLLISDLEKIERSLQKEDFYEITNGIFRKAALLDMAYNMGISKLKTFKKMIEALKIENYKKAGEELENSNYYAQVYPRSYDNKILLIDNQGGGK